MSTHDPPPAPACLPGTESSSSRNVVPFLGATKTPARVRERRFGLRSERRDATACAARAVTRATTPRLPTSLPSRQEAIRTVPPRTSARSSTRLFTSARRRPRESSFIPELWVLFDGDDVLDGSAKPARNAANARRRGSRRATYDVRSAPLASASATASGGSAPRAPRTRSHVREACRATLEGDFVRFSAELPRRRARRRRRRGGVRSSARSASCRARQRRRTRPRARLGQLDQRPLTYAVLAWRHPAAVAACVPESVSSTGIEPARRGERAPRREGAYHGASVCAANAPRSDEGSRRERSSSGRGLDAGSRPARLGRPREGRARRVGRRRTGGRRRARGTSRRVSKPRRERRRMRPCRRRVGGRARRCVCASPGLPSGSGAPPPIADVSPPAADQAATRVDARRRSAHGARAGWCETRPLGQEVKKQKVTDDEHRRWERHIPIYVIPFCCPQLLALSSLVTAGSAPWGSGNARNHEARFRHHGGCHGRDHGRDRE